MPGRRSPEAHAPVPGSPRDGAGSAGALSRRHAAGAPSARGLLFTLLGEFVLTTDGTAWTSAVLAAFRRLGIEEKATRQALMRTAAAGWLEPEKLGRRTRWRLTASAWRMLSDGAERIYSFTGPAEHWDGRWLLVYARVPESDRRARHVVRSRAQLGRVRLPRRGPVDQPAPGPQHRGRRGAPGGRPRGGRPRVRGHPVRPG